MKARTCLFFIISISSSLYANGESGDAGESVDVNGTTTDFEDLLDSFDAITDCKNGSSYMAGALLENSAKNFRALLEKCVEHADDDKLAFNKLDSADVTSPFMEQFDCHTYNEIELQYKSLNSGYELWEDRKGCSGILFDEFWDALPEGQTQNDPRHFRDVCPVQMRDANGSLFVAYMFALIYFFGGVGVAADAFMGAIEAMTAVTRTVKRDDGSHVQILVWNKTVSNLSLMALGSSAPEIMLAVVGIIGNDYRAEDLGPGTIVGSAAFNMLMIIAICVSITPSKIVEEINVLYITAFFSVWAYIWLYIICEVWTPAYITIEEGVITCVQFPVLLIIAWFADRGWFDSDVVAHKIKRMTSSGIRDPEEKLALERVVSVGGMTVRAAGTSEWNKEFRKMIKMCTKNHPAMSRDEVYVLAFEQLKHHHMAPHVEDEGVDSEVIHLEEGSDKYMVRRSSSTKAIVGNPLVGFKVSRTSTQAGAKEVVLTISCIGAHPNRLTVAFKTVAETAKDGMHFEAQRGVVVFPPLVQEKFKPDGSPISVDETVTIVLPSQPEYDLSRYFKVVLACGADVDYIRSSKETAVEVVNSYKTTGCFDSICKSFSYFFMSIFGEDESENAWLEQIRQSFRWEEDDEDDDEEDEEDEVLKRSSMSAEPKIMEEMTLQITQFSPDVAKHIEGVAEGEVDVDAAIDAMPEFDDEQGEDEDEDEGHGVLDYVGYAYFCLPRIALAFTCPPTEWLSGSLTFIFSLAWIAVFTMICGDLATGLGCTVNLKDTVTAITFVALGTSVPDTFASKIAAEQDRNADPAIGNVTGSNAVNVFLGVGLSWLIGAVYQFNQKNCDILGEIKGDGVAPNNNRCKFMVPPSKSLGFSVVLFSIMAAVWFTILMLRRRYLGGELGGNWAWKTATWITFVLMWILFIILVAMVEYGKISPGF